MTEQNKPLTAAQARVLRAARRYEQISQSDLTVYPKTLDTLIKSSYLEQVQLLDSKPYHRITEAGRVALQAGK